MVADFAETAGRIDDARRLAAVHGALSGLRRQDREVLALCAWSGPDYQESAEALEIPAGIDRPTFGKIGELLNETIMRPADASALYKAVGRMGNRPRRPDVT